MSEVFISYKREERDKARSIAEALAKRGFSVWWDIDLLPGDKFADEIAAVIEHAKAAVVLWSEAAINSAFVRAEASRAANRNILIPVRLDDCELPLPHDGLHTLDLSSWEGSANDRMLDPLISAVEKKIGRNSEPLESNEAVEHLLEQPKGEVDFWRSISEQKPQEVIEYEIYLERFGENAIFSDLARIRIKRLETATLSTANRGRKFNLTTIGAASTLAGTVIAAISLYYTMNGGSDPVKSLCEEPILQVVEDPGLCGTEEKHIVVSPHQRSNVARFIF